MRPSAGCAHQPADPFRHAQPADDDRGRGGPLLLLGTAIEDRARQQAEDAALMAVRLGLQPQFSRTTSPVASASRLIDVEEVDAASDQFGTAGETLAAFDPIELKIFGRDRTILYHSESPSWSARLAVRRTGCRARRLRRLRFAQLRRRRRRQRGRRPPAARGLRATAVRGSPIRPAPSSSTCPTRRWRPPCGTTCAP